jgi:hypothetical protein
MKLLTTIAALILTIAAHAQTADEIVDKHIAAIGGRDNINSLKSAIIESEIDIMGNPTPSTTTIIFGKAQLTEINFNGTKIINCITVDKGGWAINPMTGSTSAEAMPEEQVKASLPQLAAGGMLFNYAANGHEVVLAGREDVNGVKAWKLVLTTKEGGNCVYYIDPDTYYIVRSVAKVMMGGTEIAQGINFSDYRKTDSGNVMPFAYAIEIPTGTALQVTVKKVTINPDVDPKIFDKP